MVRTALIDRRNPIAEHKGSAKNKALFLLSNQTGILYFSKSSVVTLNAGEERTGLMAIAGSMRSLKIS